MLQSEIQNRKFGSVPYEDGGYVTFPYTNEFLRDVRDEFADLFGSDFDMTEQTAAGRIIEGAVRTFVDCVGTVALNSGQINVDYATGKYLDSIANVYDLARYEKMATTVVCRIKGIFGTVIMSGFELIDSKYRILRTESAITLGSDGMAEVSAAYDDVVDEDLVEGISSMRPRKWLPGIESVEATGTFVIGRDTESDDSLRKRIKDLRSRQENYCVEITERVSALDGVFSCFTYENGNHHNVFIDKDKNVLTEYTQGETIQVSAHSMICIVDFDTDLVGSDDDHPISEEDLSESIADIIYRYRSCGCAMTPLYRSVALSPTDPYDHIEVDSTKSSQYVVRRNVGGYGYEILFNKNEVVEYGIIVKVRKNTYYNTNKALVDDIRSALNLWQNGGVDKVDKQKVASKVYAYEIAAAISNVIPEIQIAEVTVGTGSSSSGWTNDFIAMKISQRAHCTISSNTVIYVDDTLVS